MEGKSRRSLLPQISATSRESRLPAPNSSVGRSAGPERANSAAVNSQIPHQEIEAAVIVPRHDNTQAVPPKATQQQPKANIGRSLSLRHPSTQVSNVQHGVQRAPSTRSKDSNARASRIATAKVSQSPTKETESPFPPLRQMGSSTVDTPDDDGRVSSIKNQFSPKRGRRLPSGTVRSAVMGEQLRNRSQHHKRQIYPLPQHQKPFPGPQNQQDQLSPLCNNTLPLERLRKH